MFWGIANGISVVKDADGSRNIRTFFPKDISNIIQRTTRMR